MAMARRFVTDFVDDPSISVEYCTAILDQLNIETCHVLGHSLGGMIGLRLCVTCPSRVRILTLLDSYVDIRERPAKLRNMEYPTCSKHLHDEIIDAMMDGPGVKWHANFNMTAEAKRIRCPVLELQGESAPNLDEHFATWLRAKRTGFPASWQVVRVSNSGHFVQIEQPEITLAHIVAHI